MIIENPDVFKSWLTSILEPLCDADPAALAKYVYALVKKDKPLEELRDGMLDQLDVFLQQETKPFVDMLFKSLENQDYLKPVAETKPTPPPEPEPDKEDIENQNHAAAPPPVELAERARRASIPGAGGVGGVGGAGVAGGAGAAGGGAPRPEGPRHRVVVPRARPHPQPPHHEHTLVKVLPLTELLEEPVDQPPRRRDRRGELLRDKEERRRRRSRSWERRGRPRRHPREPDHPDRRRASSRSVSPRARCRNRSPPPAVDRHASRSRSRSPGPIRERDNDRERDRMRAPREMERDRMSRDREHRDRVSRSRDRDRSREWSRDRSISPHGDTRLEHADIYKRRCRDFDVKGYCMRGDLCEWDHGVDPVVLEDAALTRVLSIPPPPVPEYNPATPDIWCGGFGGFVPPPPPHHAPRELVPIPRVRHEVPPVGAAMPPGPPPAPRHPMPLKKNFDYNRLGAPRGGVPNNCSLEVKKVPRGLNDITHLNNHFGKFGKIVNIQVCFEGDPEGALITFSNPTEASVAYKSTEAVLNNRFIKVFYHNHENKQENTAPGNKLPPPGFQHPLSQHKVLINRDNIKPTNDTKLQNNHKINNLPAKEASNGQTEVKKEAPRVPPAGVGGTGGAGVTGGAGGAGGAGDKMKQVMEMHRRAQELLQTQLRQQRLLIQRLETGNVTEPQKTALMEAINAAQEGIEKLRKELVAYNGMLRQMQANAKRPRTAQEAQKEILDAELDIITKQQEGQDVTELAKKIAEMRRQMAIQFPTHTTVRRPHSSYRIIKRKHRGGRFNTVNRYTRGGLTPKAFSMNQTVDHRPRALLVSGFEPDELEALLAHFAQFGEITGKEVNLSVPELVLQYRARAHAEVAISRAKHYNDRTLSITWVTNNKPLAAVPPQTHNGETAKEDNKDVENHRELSEDVLLRFDEEEEEDAEDRSWRR